MLLRFSASLCAVAASCFVHPLFVVILSNVRYFLRASFRVIVVLLN